MKKLPLAFIGLRLLIALAIPFIGGLLMNGGKWIAVLMVVATHTWLAKFWTLTLTAFLLDLALNHNSQFFFWACIIFGILSRIEIMLILCFLKQWAVDVPHIWNVRKLNSGLPIKRTKTTNIS